MLHLNLIGTLVLSYLCLAVTHVHPDSYGGVFVLPFMLIETVTRYSTDTPLAVRWYMINATHLELVLMYFASRKIEKKS